MLYISIKKLVLKGSIPATVSMPRSKFSTTQKLSFIQTYRERTVSLTAFSKLNNIAPDTLLDWMCLYNDFGIAGPSVSKII